MKGLKRLTLAVNIMKSYVEFIKADSFCIENFKSGEPSVLVVSILKDGKSNICEFNLDIKEDVLLTDSKGKNCLLEYAKKNKISDEEVSKQKEQFRNIVTQFAW